MFGRGVLITTFIFVVVFASTSTAIKCKNFQLEKHLKSGKLSDVGKECSGCTGYICKDSDGKRISGSGCTENVKEYCKQSWDEEKIKSIAQEENFQSENGKFLVFSCQNDNCNDLKWLDMKMSEHQKDIASIGLSNQNASPRSKRYTIVETCVPYSKNGTLRLCSMEDSPFDQICDKSDVCKCVDEGYEVPCLPEKLHATVRVCEDGTCKCWQRGRKEVLCNVPYQTIDCDKYPEQSKAKISKMSKGFVCSGMQGSAPLSAEENGAKTAGYGFILLIAPIFASIFLL